MPLKAFPSVTSIVDPKQPKVSPVQWA